jgi:hypothetical protein
MIRQQRSHRASVANPGLEVKLVRSTKESADLDFLNHSALDS